jgi:hypothetical protein
LNSLVLDFCCVPVPLVGLAKRDDRRILWQSVVVGSGSVGQLLLDELAMLVFVPRIGRLETPLQMLKEKGLG